MNAFKQPAPGNRGGLFLFGRELNRITQITKRTRPSGTTEVVPVVWTDFPRR
jgi:hypothetical protein